MPDCVILDLAYTRVPDGIWSAPVPIVGLAGDWNLLWHSYQYLVPRCDLILTDTAGVERLAAAGHEHARAAFLYGIEPEYYESRSDAPERDIDVLFVGNLHPAVQRERHPWLARLAALSGRRNVVIRTGAFGADYTALLLRAKIVFNRSIRGELNRRTIEAAAAGALVFQEAGNREAPAAFRDRKECVYYTGADLEPLLEHYLSNHTEREEIAAAGRIAADAFRVDRAWDRILATVRENESALTARAAQRIGNPTPTSLRGRVWATLGESERTPDPTLAPTLSAAASSPDRPVGVYNLLGVTVARDALLSGTGERSAVQAAATAFRQAVQADPTDPVAKLNLVEAFVALGDQDEARRELRALLDWLARDEEPTDPESWEVPTFPPTFDLFRVEWERAGWTHAGDPKGLLAARRALIRWRANLLLAQEANFLPAYYEAVIARSDLPVSRAALGCALARAGDLNAAVGHLRHAVAGDPFDIGAARALFNALDDLGARDEAARLIADRRRLSQVAPQVVPPEAWFTDPAPDQPATGTTVRPRVSLCMIVKNEERNLPDCLASVRDLVEEVVVIDTGSTDRTREVESTFGARVFEFPWRDDFAAARNESVRRATGEWVFWMDADDRLDEPAREELKRLFAGLSEPAAYVMKCRCIASRAGGSETLVDHVRLFPNDPQLQWSYRVHEQILPSIRARGLPVHWADVTIRHVGYTNAALRQQKLDRDLRLLRLEDAERPDDPFTLFNLGSVYAELEQPAVALPLLRRSLVRSAPQDSIVRKLYALIVESERALGRPGEAQATCAAGLEVCPGDAELLFLEALCHRDAGAGDRATACLQKLLSEDGGKHFGSVEDGLRGHKARHLLALLANEAGRPEEARQHLQTAVENSPAFVPSWLGLAELALDGQRWDEVDRVATKLRELGPEAAAEAEFLVGRMHFAREAFGPAKVAASAAITAVPAAIAPRVLLSHVLLREGTDLPAAERALRDVLALDPNHLEAQHNLGILLARMAAP
ncbi:glycosyltransferase [Gemmata massiliana]|nr:glycosyltransferase [Gemmata massiliana]